MLCLLALSADCRICNAQVPIRRLKAAKRVNEAAAAQQSADQVRDQAAHVAASEDAATNAAAAKATEACRLTLIRSAAIVPA